MVARGAVGRGRRGRVRGVLGGDQRRQHGERLQVGLVHFVVLESGRPRSLLPAALVLLCVGRKAFYSSRPLPSNEK